VKKNSLLISGLLILVIVSSGCVDSEASLDMEKVEGTELGEKASVDIADVHSDFRQVIEEDRFLTTESPLGDVLDHDFPVFYNGSLYSLNRTEAGKADRVRAAYTAEKVKGLESKEVNLTDGEEDIVDRILDQASAGSNISRVTYYHTYTPEEKDKSGLADSNGTVVTREDTQVLITKEREENTREQIYNCTSRKVAENLSEHSSNLREDYLFELHTSNISEDFLQGAIDETYYGEETEELKQVLEALKQGKPVRKDFNSGTWIVSYRDSTFWVEARAPSLEETN
jgi:hypothetical protein